MSIEVDIELADKFFSAFCREADPRAVIDYRNAGAVFKHLPTELEAWNRLYGYIVKYTSFPKKEAFEKVIKRDYIKAPETAKWYYDELVNAHLRASLITSADEAGEVLKSGNTKGAFEVIRQMVKTAEVDVNPLALYNFKDSHDILKQELHQKMSPGYGINFGWRTLDDMTGGFRAGDMISIVGRPGQGKSFGALAAALHVWRTQRKPILFVSMEMNPELVLERLAAMFQGIPYNWVKKGEFSTLGIDTKARYLGKLEELRDSRLPDFNVVGGNFSANVENVSDFTKQLEPSLVVVDGAYLCKTRENMRKNSDRVSYVCEYLKMEVAENGHVPVLPVWQFNREATKLKKGQYVGTEHIADSDAIPRNSSVILGLVQDDSANTTAQRQIQILKGRSGEQGRFNINWNFRTMDFSEVEPIDDEEVFTT